MTDRKLDDQLQTPSIGCLCKTLASSSSMSSPRPLKAWLLPLLFRVNLAGIVAELPTLRDNCKDLAAIHLCVPVLPSLLFGPSLRKGWGWMR